MAVAEKGVIFAELPELSGLLVFLALTSISIPPDFPHPTA